MRHTTAMFVLILFILGAAGMALLAQYNLTPVTVNLGYYVFTDIPLFYVMVFSLLIGLLLAYIFYLADWFSTSLMLKKKDRKLQSTKASVYELTKQIHKLELENERLKKESPLGNIDEEDKFL